MQSSDRRQRRLGAVGLHLREAVKEGEVGMSFGIVIPWLILSLIAGSIAYNKGLSSIAYFLFAVFFTPVIGVLAALVAKPDQAVLEGRAIRSGGMRKCPECAELVRQDAKRCKHCGAEIKDWIASDAMPSRHADREQAWIRVALGLFILVSAIAVGVGIRTCTQQQAIREKMMRPVMGLATEPSRAPAPVSEPPASVTKAQILEVQRALRSAGYSPGPADGVMGRRTRQAIELWQSQHGQIVTGVVDANLAWMIRNRQ